MTNADRANVAAAAVRAHSRLVRNDSEPMATRIADMVSDALHLLRRECDVHPDDLAGWLHDRLDMHNIELAEDDEE